MDRELAEATLVASEIGCRVESEEVLVSGRRAPEGSCPGDMGTFGVANRREL